MEHMVVYTTRDLCELLKCNRTKIQWLRDSGLLKCRRFGKGYLTTQDELKEFFDITSGLDLGSKQKIMLAKQLIKNRPA